MGEQTLETMTEYTEFYRFPPMAGTDEYGTMQQCAYIRGEADEAVGACTEMLERFYRSYGTRRRCYLESACEARKAYGMELMDVIHAAETALRIEFSDFEVGRLRDAVERKNRERGYYGE